MGSLTNAEDLLVLAHFFGGVTLHAVDATLYFRLTTTVPTKAAAGTEVSTGVWTNYTPIGKTNDQTNFPAPTTIANVATNKNGTIVDFGTATTTGNVDVVGFEVWTASSGGTRRGWGTTTKTVANGNAVSFPVDSLVFTQS